jgi:hypothetical protein
MIHRSLRKNGDVTAAGTAPAENLIHAGWRGVAGRADVVRDSGQRSARATENAVAW